MRRNFCAGTSRRRRAFSAARFRAGRWDRRLRIRAPRRSRIPPVTGIPPGAQPRSGNPQLPGNLAQRLAAARQQSYRLPLELIRELTTRCTHGQPSRLANRPPSARPEIRRRAAQSCLARRNRRPGAAAQRHPGPGQMDVHNRKSPRQNGPRHPEPASTKAHPTKSPFATVLEAPRPPVPSSA